MNFSEMQTVLRRYGFDNNDPLATWLNAAMHDLEDDFDWPWLEMAIQFIEMPAKSNTLTLPSNTLKIMGIRDTINLYKLKYYDRKRFFRDIREPTEEGLPEIYTLINTNQVQIWRVLESPIKFEVQLQGSTPSMVQPTDEPTTSGNVWPENAHYPIVVRAAAIALMAENEEDRAKQAMAEYESSLMRLKAKFAERELDEPTTVQDAQGYATEGPLRWSY